MRRGSAEHSTGPMTCRFANAARSPRRGVQPLGSAPGRLERATFCSGGSSSITPRGEMASNSFAAGRHPAPPSTWNWPTWRYSRPAAAAISASHGKPPDDPFRQAGTERAEALLPLLHQAIQDGSSGGRDSEAKMGRCQLHRGGKGGWTLPARDARNGGCHSLAAWGKTLARQHQLHPNRRVPGRQPRRPPVSDQDTLGSRDRGVPAHRLWAIAEVATLMGQVRLTGLEPATSTSGAWRSLRAELQAREG